jgi:hypothetical protein
MAMAMVMVMVQIVLVMAIGEEEVGKPVKGDWQKGKIGQKPLFRFSVFSSSF